MEQKGLVMAKGELLEWLNGIAQTAKISRRNGSEAPTEWLREFVEMAQKKWTEWLRKLTRMAQKDCKNG